MRTPGTYTIYWADGSKPQVYGNGFDAFDFIQDDWSDRAVFSQWRTLPDGHQRMNFWRSREDEAAGLPAAGWIIR